MAKYWYVGVPTWSYGIVKTDDDATEADAVAMIQDSGLAGSEMYRDLEDDDDPTYGEAFAEPFTGQNGWDVEGEDENGDGDE